MCERSVNGGVASCGFSPEAWAVVQRKPQARYADFSSGNKMMWSHLPEPRSSPYWIYMDKQEGLYRQPDMLVNWRELSRHFPSGYFKVGILDPPHYWNFSTSKIHNNPASSNGGWWGSPKSKNELLCDLLIGQREIARVLDGPLLVKWCETAISFPIGLFTEWREMQRYKVVSKRKRSNNLTWWIKLVRKN